MESTADGAVTSSKDKSFQIQDNQKVVFIGDSITDCGRMDEATPLGNGYVKIAVDLVTAKYPERQITFLNRGISGDVALGLRDSWADDVLAHNPNWVSVMIGINNLHHSLCPDPEAHIPPEKYRQAYSQFFEETRKNTKAKLTLMDPFYIMTEKDANSEQRIALEALGGYIAVVREMVEKFDALHVTTHDVFQRQLQHRRWDAFCPEPVHPNATGHRIIAYAWLQAAGW